MTHRMSLKTQMQWWREGLIPFPQDYVVLHKTAALADLPRLLAKLNLTNAGTRMVSDGWMDGMRVVQAAGLTDPWNGGGTRIFQWSDSNGGSWFEKLPSGGLTLVEAAPNAPGHI